MKFNTLAWHLLPPFHYIRCFSFVKQIYLDIYILKRREYLCRSITQNFVPVIMRDTLTAAAHCMRHACMPLNVRTHTYTCNTYAPTRYEWLFVSSHASAVMPTLISVIIISSTYWRFLCTTTCRAIYESSRSESCMHGLATEAFIDGKMCLLGLLFCISRCIYFHLI
jgi:hypothetical protein